jgi:hypothetical protein
MQRMRMADRITPYSDGGSIEDRIDEIVQTGVDVHFEALDESIAMLIVGRYHFRVEARKGKLFCWLYEDENEVA